MTLPKTSRRKPTEVSERRLGALLDVASKSEVLLGALKVAWGHHFEGIRSEMWELNQLEQALKQLERTE